MIHELKIKRVYFNEVISGGKTFEIRKNDRGFRCGDTVVLNEIDDFSGEAMGSRITAIIGFIIDFEQKDGYVVFSLRHLRDEVFK